MRLGPMLISIVMGTMVVLLSIPATLGVAAGKMPDELIGKWSDGTEGACVNEISAKGYAGGTEDRYSCTVESVRKVSRPGASTLSWSMGFFCVGEFGRVRSSELMELQMGGGSLNVVILGPKEALDVVNSRVWTWHKCK